VCTRLTHVCCQFGYYLRTCCSTFTHCAFARSFTAAFDCCCVRTHSAFGCCCALLRIAAFAGTPVRFHATALLIAFSWFSLHLRVARVCAAVGCRLLLRLPTFVPPVVYIRFALPYLVAPAVYRVVIGWLQLILLPFITHFRYCCWLRSFARLHTVPGLPIPTVTHHTADDPRIARIPVHLTLVGLRFVLIPFWTFRSGTTGTFTRFALRCYVRGSRCLRMIHVVAVAYTCVCVCAVTLLPRC